MIGKKLNKKFIKFLLISIILIFILILNILFVRNIFLKEDKIDNNALKDKEVIVKSMVGLCQEEELWRNCYGNSFKKLAEKNYAFQELTQILDEIGNLDYRARDCHIMAHSIMSTLVEKDPDNWKLYLEELDPNTCTYGYIHGLVEAKSLKDSSFILTPQTIPDFCALVLELKKTRGTDQTCSHIVGHIVLAQEEDNIESAVDICNSIPNILQRECFSGLFMEHYTRDNLVAHGIGKYIPWTEENILIQENLCNAQDGNAGLGCWQAIGSMYLQQVPFDPEYTYQRCGKAKYSNYTNRCYMDTITGLVAIPEPGFTKNYANSLCGRFENDPATFDECMNYPVRGLLVASIKNFDRAAKYCDYISLQYKKMCYGLIGDVLDQIVLPGKKIDFCNNFIDIYKQACMSDADYWKV